VTSSAAITAASLTPSLAWMATSPPLKRCSIADHFTVHQLVEKPSARPADIPSRIPYSGTKPTTIAGWTVREVYSGMATLEGPDGIRRAARGDTVPRVGRVKAILRWDGRWIVLTSSGVISTR
jgi:hypothetical protein